MALSTYAGNAALDAIFNAGSLQVAAAYASLHSGDPGLDGSNELSGNDYARVQTEFDAPSPTGQTDNTNVETYTAASGDWAEASHCGLWDAGSAGNFLVGGSLDSAVTVLSGEIARWAAGDLDFQISTLFSDAYLDHIVNALLRNVELTVTNTYASLHSGDPGGTGANELSGNNYARVLASFDAADSKEVSNDAQMETGDASGDWSPATHMGLWSHVSETGAGYFVWGKQLTNARTVRSGKRFIWEVGDIDVSIA